MSCLAQVKHTTAVVYVEAQEMTEELCGEFKKSEDPLKADTASGSPLPG